MSLRNTVIFWRQAVWKTITKLGNVYIVLPIILLLFLLNKSLGIKLLVGVIGITAIATLIRLVYFKERPKKRPTKTLYQKIDASSFPSIHAARAFFFAMTLTRYYQSPGIGVMMFILAILVAYSRYTLHHHYASDIIGGTLLGILMSYGLELEWVISRVPGL